MEIHERQDEIAKNIKIMEEERKVTEEIKILEEIKNRLLKDMFV